MDPTARHDFREVVRGLRRHIEQLEDAHFVTIPAAGRARAEDNNSCAAAAAPAAAPLSTNVNVAPVHKSLPFECSENSETRRGSAPARGESRRNGDDRAGALAAIQTDVAACRLCRLCEGRAHAVPGEGSPSARVMFVGEGPGATEDEMGRPFVGRAGQLLTKIIESGMGLSRADVFIANIVKCRPPENRDPQPDEVAACVPYLHKQIEVIDPDVIIPLGRHSMRELAGVGEKDTISRVRGKVYRVNGRAVIPTFHPAYLLRNPPEKVKVWHDIQLAMKELGLPISGNAPGAESKE